MRGWKAVTQCGVAAVLAAALASEPAGAVGCYMCDPSLSCAGADQGAKFCLQGMLTCTVAIPCLYGPRRESDSSESLTTWSLFELAGAPATMGVDTDAGPLSVGELMRSARTRGSGPLVDATLAFGEGVAAVLSDAAGDGFAVRRSEQGGGVRIEVLEVIRDQPGRVLADAVLGPRDRLHVPIRAAGGERLLVLQADDVPAGLARATIARLQASLREAAGMRSERNEPLFRTRALQP